MPKKESTPTCPRNQAIVKKESENSKESMLFTVAFGVNYGDVKTLDLQSWPKGYWTATEEEINTTSLQF